MATTGTTEINDVLARLRDTGFLMATIAPPTTASGRAFTLTIINHCQIFINLAERIMMASSDLYLSPNTTIYDLTLDVNTDYGGYVVGCNVAGVREIDGPVDYKALGRTSRTWITDVNANVTTAPISWAPIGNTLIAFVPAFTASLPPVVTIRYVQAPIFAATEDKTLALPDFAMGHLARLATLVASIKTCQLTDFQNRLQALAKDILGSATLYATGGKAS